jgi:hypothetical protein
MHIGYLDPASGSILASALVGGAAAIGVAAKSARSRLTGAFKRKPAPEPAGTEDGSAGPSPDVAVDADA